MKLYPKLNGSTMREIVDWINAVTSERMVDRQEFEGLPNILIRGRNRTLLSNRATPSSSTDVVSTDAEGDFMVTTTYLYILVNNSGSYVWRRVALSSF